MIIDRFKLVFPDEFSERDEIEMEMRGYLSHLYVETTDGERYPIYFIDPKRLSQDLDDYLKLGIPCLAEPGLIVLPRISKEYIEKAFIYLVKSGYFLAVHYPRD